MTSEPSPILVQAGAGRVALSALDEAQRAEVLRHCQLLPPHLYDGLPLAGPLGKLGFLPRIA